MPNGLDIGFVPTEGHTKEGRCIGANAASFSPNFIARRNALKNLLWQKHEGQSQEHSVTNTEDIDSPPMYLNDVVPNRERPKGGRGIGANARPSFICNLCAEVYQQAG